MKKCLVVDDVEVTRFTSEQIIVSLGMETVQASSPEEALAAIKNASMDVVLLDWHLRKMSGLDLLKGLKEGAKPGMKIVVFSGVEGEEKRQEALQAGADAFLAKPTTKEKIERCFKDLGIL